MEWHTLALVAVTAGVTILLRFLPFWIFGGGRKTPKVITYLGKVLPCAMMAILVVYCLRDISFAEGSAFLPQVIACATVVLLHLWRRSTILSILGGTVCYMLLIRIIV